LRTEGTAQAEGQRTGIYSPAEMDLYNYTKRFFDEYVINRQPFEEEWEEDWYNFLGQYQKNANWFPVTEGSAGRSKIFIKLTALKTNTAHSKIQDSLFPAESANDVPFDLEYIGEDIVGIPADQMEKLRDALKKRLIQHFREIRLQEKFDSASLDLCILGTAVFKSPIIEIVKQVLPRRRMIQGMPARDVGGPPFTLETITKILANVEPLPLWSYYCDVNARPGESAFEFHYERMAPHAFRTLAYQPGYDKETIIEMSNLIDDRADDKDFTATILGNKYIGESFEKDKRIGVAEGWGTVPTEIAVNAGIEVPNDDSPDTPVLVVLAGNRVIKATFHPLAGKSPFKVCPYKKVPHRIYGIGVPRMMRDSQKMVNSSARLIIDNKALSGSGMIAVNRERIDTKLTKDLRIYPRKVWYLKGNYAPKDAIDEILFKDITRGLVELMEMFERFSDEETGIPKYSSGQQDSFLNKTAAGMSMLMTQANINLKAVVKNIDDYWIEPIVEDMADWFMQTTQGARGLFRVRATGAASLMAKEVMQERVAQFFQITGKNPQDAIFVDRPELMRELAKLLNLQKCIRPKEEVEKILMKLAQDAMAGGGEAIGPPAEPPAASALPPGGRR